MLLEGGGADAEKEGWTCVTAKSQHAAGGGRGELTCVFGFRHCTGTGRVAAESTDKKKRTASFRYPK